MATRPNSSKVQPRSQPRASTIVTVAAGEYERLLKGEISSEQYIAVMKERLPGATASRKEDARSCAG